MSRTIEPLSEQEIANMRQRVTWAGYDVPRNISVPERWPTSYRDDVSALLADRARLEARVALLSECLDMLRLVHEKAVIYSTGKHSLSYGIIRDLIARIEEAAAVQPAADEPS